MSATVRIRVDLADPPIVEIPGFTGPSLRVERCVRVGDTLEHLGTAVRLEAESLEALRDWLAESAKEVDARSPQPERLVDRWEDDGGAIADAGALA